VKSFALSFEIRRYDPSGAHPDCSSLETFSGNCSQKRSTLSQLLFLYSQGGGEGIKRGQRNNCCGCYGEVI
jgi:hypothetical protein